MLNATRHRCWGGSVLTLKLNVCSVLCPRCSRVLEGSLEFIVLFFLFLLKRLKRRPSLSNAPFAIRSFEWGVRCFQSNELTRRSLTSKGKEDASVSEVVLLSEQPNPWFGGGNAENCNLNGDAKSVCTCPGS